MSGNETRPAAWHATAEEIDPEEARRHPTLADVCDRTGLRQLTILYAMNRTGQYTNLKPMHILARPAYRTNGSEPRWSDEQIAKYFDLLTERTRTYNERYGHLPVVTAAEARSRQLVSLRAIKRVSGFALTTLHRWADDTAFPPATARTASRGPVPQLLRPWSDVRRYLMDKRSDAVLPTVLTADAYRNA